MASDNNAEIVYLRIPRYFDDCDFSARTCTVSYNNALKERGVYTVRETMIEDDSLLLPWYISNHVTKKSGKIHFVVEFKKDLDERGLSYSWSTLPAELNVMAGLDDDIAISESDISLYKHLLSCLQATDRRVAGLMQQIGQAQNPEIDSLKEKLKELKAAVDDLCENAAYVNVKNIPDEKIRTLFS